MCIYYRQALDVAIEYWLPWYVDPKETIDTIATDIAGGILDMCPEKYNGELISFWYLYLSYDDEQIGRFLPGRDVEDKRLADIRRARRLRNDKDSD